MEFKDIHDYPVKAINVIIAKKGFLQKTIAIKAGFTEQQFSDMLNGRKVIRAEYIPVIAKALGVTPNDLFSCPDNTSFTTIDDKPA